MEGAVLKTIAAFMNTEGGSLLIGVGDDGHPLGLEKDIETLKNKNQDGFEVALMTAIATRLGTPQCTRVTILFHTIKHHDICHVLVSKSPTAVFLETGKETKLIHAKAKNLSQSLHRSDHHVLYESKRTVHPVDH